MFSQEVISECFEATDSILFGAFSQLHPHLTDRRGASKTRSVKRALSRGDLLNKPSLQATSGLIAFRRGDLKVGSQLYEDAIREASEQNNPERAAKARLFYALEALRAKHPDAIHLAEAAFVACSAWKNSDFEMLQRRLQRAVEVYLSNRRNESQRSA